VERAEGIHEFGKAGESRHGSWPGGGNREETLSFLEEHRLPLACVDMPQGFDSSVPPIAAATADDLSVVRFHGRDPEAWARKDATAAERFKYLYERRELEEWVPKIRSLAERTRETHVLFNNCYRDYAVRNARDLQGLLNLEG